ncbi:MAG: DUF4954 family protein [Dysgonamonadaceae bacterium]|jgi:hypothetical protein|nr:DUF4954 family protein [Dysgonamonadaceae bacterium]
MYRRLSRLEVKSLCARGCSCNDWGKVNVSEGFDTEFVRNVVFSGKVRLGIYNNEVELVGGVKKHAGIFNSSIHNCKVCDNVYINNAGNIANYTIQEGAIIENVDLLAVDKVSSFGNGLLINVLDETGGRKIPIFDRLSAQITYIMVLYRYKPDVIDRITEMINKYVRSIESDMGIVGRFARVSGCRIIKNMRIGEFACVEGVQSMTNGTLCSCKEAPVYIGPGVIADNFIACGNSELSQGANVFDSFVGEGCIIGKQFSAESSLFFSNCICLNGEACSVFAGPYTVTHHKSTLLIAGYYSFLNAGSGSNQSNHLYKLGPVHQCIMDRGVKTGSDSYIMLPARIGAFSLIMGKHYKHPDTSDMPFSYLIEQDGESVLVPCINIRSAGTFRDARKWETRDRRTGSKQLDCINFNLLSPFSVSRILKGIGILTSLKGTESDSYYWNNTRIYRSALEKGLRLYELAVNVFIGDSLVRRIDGLHFDSAEDLKKRLLPNTVTGTGEWIDIAGLTTPKSEVDRLLTDIKTGDTDSLYAISERFAKMHCYYGMYEWRWTVDLIEKWFGMDVEKFAVADVVRIVEVWKDSVVSLDNLICADAQKEFATEFRVGFGIDGNDDDIDRDFKIVRGEFENNIFVREIKDNTRKKIELGNKLIAEITKI